MFDRISYITGGWPDFFHQQYHSHTSTYGILEWEWYGNSLGIGVPLFVARPNKKNTMERERERRNKQYIYIRNPRWERWVFARFVFFPFFPFSAFQMSKNSGKTKKTKKNNPVRRILGKSM